MVELLLITITKQTRNFLNIYYIDTKYKIKNKLNELSE